MVALVQGGEQTRGELAMVRQHVQRVELGLGKARVQTVDLGDQIRIRNGHGPRANANQAGIESAMKVDVGFVWRRHQTVEKPPEVGEPGEKRAWDRVQFPAIFVEEQLDEKQGDGCSQPVFEEHLFCDVEERHVLPWVEDRELIPAK